MVRPGRNKRCVRATITLIVCAATSDAAAQSAAAGAAPSVAQTPSTSRKIEEVVVTAQKRSQRLQKVPVAITALTSKQLVNSGVTSATGLANHVATLTVAEGGGGTLLPFLRGVGNPDAVNGNESSVAVYLDDVYVSRLDQAFLELYDINRIEVLNGPQGTLFGRNASAGLLNIITRDPSSTFQGSAAVGYGNYNTTTEKLYLSGPVATGVAANISVLNGWQGEGWGRNITSNAPVGYNDPLIVRSKWLFDLSSTTRLRVSADYSQSSSDLGAYTNNIPGTSVGSPDFYSLAPYNRAPVRHSPVGFYDEQNYYPLQTHKRGFGGSARLDQDLGFAEFSSITGYRQNAEDYQVDGTYSPEPGLAYALNSHSRTFTQEFQLASKPGSVVDWIAGLFYLNEFASYEPTGITGPGLAIDVLGGAFGPVLPHGSEVGLYSHERTKDYAAYGQTTIHLPFSTNLTLGIRYTIDDLDGGGNTRVGVPGIGVFNTPAKDSAEFQEPSFKFGLDHSFGNNLLTYISVSRGFKAGTYNLLPFSAPPTKPEQLTAYEIGAKSTLLDGRLLLNGAFFYYNLGDPQVQEVVNHLIFLANAGSAQVLGGELQAEYVILPGLTARAGGAYLDSHYTNFPNAPFYTPNPDPPYGSLSTAGNADGKQLPEAPKFAFNFGFNYDTAFSWGRLNFNQNYAFRGSFYFSPDNFIHQKSYGLLDASVTYMLPNNDHWSLRAYGKNITGTRYYIGGEENSGSEGFVYAPGAPAIYGGILTYTF